MGLSDRGERPEEANYGSRSFLSGEGTEMSGEDVGAGETSSEATSISLSDPGCD